MKYLIVLSSLIWCASSGIIPEDHHDHHQATSYQNIHMEHFHAVPTHMKKEDFHYLEHPVSEGNTHSKIEIHHGSKHDPGFAVANVHSDFHGHHENHDFVALGKHSLPKLYEDHNEKQVNLHEEEYSGENTYEEEAPQHIEEEDQEHNYKQTHDSSEHADESGEAESDGPYQYQEGQDSYERSNEEHQEYYH